MIVGGSPGLLVGIDWIAAVGVEVAAPDPAGLVAVTTTWIVFAASTAWSTYVLLVAPEMSAQVVSQRCHW